MFGLAGEIVGTFTKLLKFSKRPYSKRLASSRAHQQLIAKSEFKSALRHRLPKNIDNLPFPVRLY